MEEIISIESLEKTSKMLEKRVSHSRMVRVPPRLYQAHTQSYTPHFISIGPFHYVGLRSNDLNLVAMESQKRVYMLRLLDRTHSRDETLDVCWKLAQEMAPERVRSCYTEDHEVVGVACLEEDEILARVILVDACFLLELLIWSYEGSYCLNVVDDGCGSMTRMILGLRRDLPLLENQLPFFVLQELYDTIYPCIRNKTSTPIPELTELVLHFFRLPSTQQRQFSPHDHLHILDLISKYHQTPVSQNNYHHHNFYWPNNDNSHSNTSKLPLSRGVVLRNATSLSEAGVIFHRGKTSNMLDIKFNHGILEIPPLVINDCNESLLRNLLAFEHTSKTRDEFFVSYVIFMDHLIGSKEDLQLLESQGIVVNELGGRDNVTKFFHHISKDFVLKNFYFRHLCRKIEKFCESPRQRYVQELKKRYLNSPWTTLSLVAAIVLLFLTAIQTVYSVLSYYKQGF